MCLAESMYLQLLEAQEKLPNKIRIILGLPEKEEPSEATTDSTPDRDPVVMSDSVLRSPSPTAPSPTIEEQSLELNCDLGISQFM